MIFLHDVQMSSVTLNTEEVKIYQKSTNINKCLLLKLWCVSHLCSKLHQMFVCKMTANKLEQNENKVIHTKANKQKVVENKGNKLTSKGLA